jgi:GTP-binding protein EngB required for normal cell division
VGYKHKKYPIVFYDISGFNENEDNEIRNLNSKIEESNKNYLKINNKIHAVFYVIDCNTVRVLQNKEKKAIENIFKVNIPIFIVGQRAQKTNIKNFIRKVKFDLNILSNDYNKKIETIKNRIICLKSSKESVLSLL